MFCSRSISQLGEILIYVKIKYWMSMRRAPVNWLVVLLLMAVMYFASTANTSFLMRNRSTPPVSWKTRKFSSYWRFSYSWAWQVAAIGMLSFPGCT